MLDRCRETGPVEFLTGLPPNAAKAVILKLVECCLIAPENAAPLVDCPVAVLKGPFETIRHVSLSQEGLTAGDARAETSVSKGTSNGVYRDGVSGLLFPQRTNLTEGEAAVFFVRNKFSERSLGAQAKDLWSAWAFSGTGGSGGLKPPKRVADGCLATPDLRRDGLE